eukprot:1072710-Alexandrium_andersonii.AAC.1
MGELVMGTNAASGGSTIPFPSNRKDSYRRAYLENKSERASETNPEMTLGRAPKRRHSPVAESLLTAT